MFLKFWSFASKKVSISRLFNIVFSIFFILEFSFGDILFDSKKHFQLVDYDFFFQICQ